MLVERVTGERRSWSIFGFGKVLREQVWVLWDRAEL